MDGRTGRKMSFNIMKFLVCLWSLRKCKKKTKKQNTKVEKGECAVGKNKSWTFWRISSGRGVDVDSRASFSGAAVEKLHCQFPPRLSHRFVKLIAALLSVCGQVWSLFRDDVRRMDERWYRNKRDNSQCSLFTLWTPTTPTLTSVKTGSLKWNLYQILAVGGPALYPNTKNCAKNTASLGRW